MTWLRRLCGKDVNPEEHERVRCDACDGKGVIMSGPFTGEYEGHVETYRCWKYHGKGWLLEKRP